MKFVDYLDPEEFELILDELVYNSLNLNLVRRHFCSLRIAGNNGESVDGVH
jgi:hypothetical protein